MNRLTEWRDGHGSWVTGDAYTKLAKYEDTGLEPEEVTDLIRKASCIPCSIGDEVYVRGIRGARGNITVMSVVGIEIGRGWTLLKIASRNSDFISYLNMSELGRKFFFSKEEAVAKAGKTM